MTMTVWIIEACLLSAIIGLAYTVLSLGRE